MSMDLEKKTFSTQPDYLIAGTAEIVTAAKEAAATLKRGAPVVLDGSGKLAAVTVSGGPGTYKTEATGLYGILAEDVKSGEQGVVYLSGEFLPMHWYCLPMALRRIWRFLSAHWASF